MSAINYVSVPWTALNISEFNDDSETRWETQRLCRQFCRLTMPYTLQFRGHFNPACCCCCWFSSYEDVQFLWRLVFLLFGLFAAWFWPSEHLKMLSQQLCFPFPLFHFFQVTVLHPVTASSVLLYPSECPAAVYTECTTYWTGCKMSAPGVTPLWQSQNVVFSCCGGELDPTPVTCAFLTWEVKFQ